MNLDVNMVGVFTNCINTTTLRSWIKPYLQFFALLIKWKGQANMVKHIGVEFTVT